MPAAIAFHDVSKWFTLYHNQSRTIQETLLSWLPFGDRFRDSKEQFWALKDVSFAVERGETLGLIGSNGSGKSTALKLMSRILEPTSGTVEINGRISALLELGAGFHPDLTGRENVFLNGSLMGLGRKTMQDAFDEIVEFSELEEFIDMPVKHYSSGMYMRLAFSIAIHVEPEILLVDEVLAVGDGNFQRKCTEHIARLRREGVTIVLVSHDLDSVARLCHKVVWLEKGKVREFGPGREVVNNYIADINERQHEKLLEAAEAEQATAEAGDDANASANGTGAQALRLYDAQITGIQLIDGDDEPVSSVRTGEDLIIRVCYDAPRRIERPQFGLGLHRDDDVHVTGPNTQVDDVQIPHIEGEGYVDYILRRAPLMAGRYYVSASIFDETHTHCYHYVHQIHSFLIQPHSTWDRLGVVRLPGEWRFYQSLDGDATSGGAQQSNANGVPRPALVTEPDPQ